MAETTSAYTGRILTAPPTRIGKVDGTPDLSGRRAAFYDVLPDKSGVPVAVSSAPAYTYTSCATPVVAATGCA